MKPPPQKLRVYETLFTLNQGFEQLLGNFQRLQELSFFRRALVREFQVILKETRAWANFELVEFMCQVEQDDWARFGLLRRKLAKKHEDPNDV